VSLILVEAKILQIKNFQRSTFQYNIMFHVYDTHLMQNRKQNNISMILSKANVTNKQYIHSFQQRQYLET